MSRNPDYIQKTDVEQLEAFVDMYGLKNVLDTLATICQAKSEHIAYTWDGGEDTSDLVRAWKRDATRLERVTVSVSQSGYARKLGGVA